MALPNVTNLQITSGAGVVPVVLTWTGIDAEVHGGHRYAIYRKLSTQAWPSEGGTPIGYVTAPTTTYTDTTAQAGRTYNYRVRHTFGSASEWCEVIAKGPDYLDVNRIGVNTPFGPHSHAAGAYFDLDKASGWTRPFGAFTSAVNGRGENDIGIANGFKNRSADWRPTNGAHASWRGGYIGHPDYEAQFDALWPILDYDSAGTASSVGRGLTFTNTYDGNECWIQWRMYVDARRLLPTASDGKLIYLQPPSGGGGASASQFYLTLAPLQHGAELSFQHDGQPVISSVTIPTLDDGVPYQVLGDTWCTWMLHLKPGHVMVPDGTLELFVAHPGDTAWRTLSSTSTFAYHFAWDYDGVDWNNSAIFNPPGHNAFRLQVFGNHYEGTSSSGASGNPFHVSYSQLIVSTQPIPLPAQP